ncbi:MAG: hypothetical protein E1N59_2186 [Puniceicoccaceae bacterium 5H]|nr:MAG: hypothetical protein E1N59_2186 [Puniceicoccaceae bacterium 5H]
MGLFGRFFAWIKQRGQQPVAKSDGGSADPAATVEVVDEFGRRLEVPRAEWRENILLPNLKQHWNDPDELAGLIASACNDGFRADVIKASEHLCKIDPNHSRGANVWAMVLAQEGRLGEGCKVLQRKRRDHGDDVQTIVNLGRLRLQQGKVEDAETLFQQAVQLDPNHTDAILCRVARTKDPEAYKAGLRRITELPGSWKAFLWLAEQLLQEREVDEALQCYREMLERAPDHLPGDVLTKMGGDLGNVGCLIESIQFVAPYFKPEIHGVQVGNNLIKSYFDLGRLDEAKAVLEQLYASTPVALRNILKYWEDEISKQEAEIQESPDPEMLKVGQRLIPGPIWFPNHHDLEEAFEVEALEEISVAFVGSSYEGEDLERVGFQRSDGAGRFTRALPLFLSQEVYYRHHVDTFTFIPWLEAPQSAYAISRVQADFEAVAGMARHEAVQADYVVYTHLKLDTETRWSVELSLIRTIDARCLDSFVQQIETERMDEGLLAIRNRLQKSLVEHAELSAQPVSPPYELPPPEAWSYYLLRLEQLLTLKIASAEREPAGIYGERDIVDGLLDQCLDQPQNPHIRLMLAQGIKALQRFKPAIVLEFKDQVEKLQQRYPLDGEVGQAVAAYLDDILSDTVETEDFGINEASQ